MKIKKISLNFIVINFICLVVILTAIFNINITNAKEFNSLLFGENYIIDNSGIISKTYINLINEKNKEIYDKYGYNIYTYITNDTEYLIEEKKEASLQLEDFASKLYDEEILGEDILIVVDLKNRYMSIKYPNEIYDINKNSIITNYSKESFSQNNFNKAILETIDGIVDTNNKNLLYEAQNSINPYASIDETIIFDSYIIDQTNTLTDAELDYLETNAYKINNNYDYKIYIGLLNSKKYLPDIFTAKIFNDNFAFKDNITLVIFYMDSGKISTMSSSYINADIIELYDSYAKEYFHSSPKNYKQGLYELQNAIISDIENIETNTIKELDVSGTQKSQTSEDVNIIFSYLKIIGFVFIIILVILILILLIKSLLLNEEKIKYDILNNEPEKAFSNLEKEITKKEIFIKEDKVDQSMNDLYQNVAEDMWEKSLEKKEYKKEINNIFDSNFNTSSENELVIKSINDMIINLVEKADGTKEFYQELQSALDVYNGLSFSDRMKLDRKYTSELEQLTRKAKIDKELYEKHIKE